MKMHAVSCLLGLASVLACEGTERGPSAGDRDTDRLAVERAIRVWFDSGLATQDTARIRAALAGDFAILEDSLWFDRDGFVKAVAGLKAWVGGPFTLQYDLSDWRTTVEGNLAWTSLTNRALLTPAKGTPTRLAWRETAVLRRRDTTWQIVRYHSAASR